MEKETEKQTNLGKSEYRLCAPHITAVSVLRVLGVRKTCDCIRKYPRC